MTNAFDNLIADAEQREADIAAQKLLAEQERRKAATEADETRRREEAEKRQIMMLRNFGEGFLQAVATRVVNPTWSSSYIRAIKSFAETLLLQSDPTGNLPDINERHARKIFDKFDYGLRLAEERGDTIPDGLFYGQRQLAEMAEQAEQTEEKPLRIVKGIKPKAPSQGSHTAKVIELPPATTPKKRKQEKVSASN